MPERPIFEGDLRRIQIADVLSFVGMIRGSGKLLLRHGRLERTLHWKDGEIVFASSNSNEQSLGQFLLRNGKITEEQYRESAQKVTPNMRHGKALVQMGAISPNDLWWGLKNQALEIIYSLFTWNEGSFSFAEAEEGLQERIALSINTSSAIMEGIRRLDESVRIREKITSVDMVFAKVPGAVPNFQELEMSEDEIAVYNNIDGSLTVRELIGKSELTDFEVTRILFQLLMARLIEVAPEEKEARPLFLDVEDEPELRKIISTYNDMFGRLHDSLAGAVGDGAAREILGTTLESAAADEDLWNGVFFDQYGRFDENMLMANISELPFERRKTALDEGLNSLLSVQLYEASQHLDTEGKLDVFRFISDQKAAMEETA
jgi:hypothetical protein